MKGKLFGIGAGPGDPELLTLKAVKTLQKCEVIAIPESGSGESVAFSIVEEHIKGKELIECRFAMEKDMTKRKETRRNTADKIIRYLDKGTDVGFVTLGDPTTYSTFMYVHELITDRGFVSEIIPGITSFAAAAAALGIALCKDDEPLMVIPARHVGDMDELLDYQGNKVIMKSGGNLASVLAKLKARGDNA